LEISATTATAQAQVLLQDKIAVGVLKMSLDMSAEQGAALVKMLDQAGGLGQRVDLHG
jgi:hypothetical protein